MRVQGEIEGMAGMLLCGDPANPSLDSLVLYLGESL